MPKPKSPTESGLTFDWRKPRGEWPRLLLWMLVTFAGLAGFFALFRVVYPQAQRIVPTAQQIIVLGSDPSTQPAINFVEDHDFLIIPSPDDRKNPVSLEDRAPVFHPSYEKHELRLLDLPQRDTTPPPVRLLDVREPVLPRLDLAELRRDPPAPATPRKLVAEIRGQLAHRPLEGQPDFEGLALPEPESWRFCVGVNGAGRVSFALPLDTPGKMEEAAPLLRLIRQLRFAPDASGKTTWGEASLAWKPSAPSANAR